MPKFRVGDKVGFYGITGTVKEVHEKSLFVKRSDGVGGSAWEGTPQEGLWRVDVSCSELIKRFAPVLENK